MPAGGPVLEYLWRLVRDNPEVIPEIVRGVKDRFGSRPPEAPVQAEASREVPAVERVDQLEADLTAAGRLIGSLEARLAEMRSRTQALEQRLERSETELARLSTAEVRLAARLRKTAIGLAGCLSAAFALLIYLLATRH